jgi:hypothetical protein
MMLDDQQSLPPLTPTKKISRGESEGSTPTTGTSAIWEDRWCRLGPAKKCSCYELPGKT